MHRYIHRCTKQNIYNNIVLIAQFISIARSLCVFYAIHLIIICLGEIHAAHWYSRFDKFCTVDLLESEVDAWESPLIFVKRHFTVLHYCPPRLHAPGFIARVSAKFITIRAQFRNEINTLCNSHECLKQKL